MIDKEKVRELTDDILNTFADPYEAIIKWLEQNQPDSVVVGLSDVQIEDLADAIYGKSIGQQHCRELYDRIIKNWLKNQTFAQPEVTELEKEYDSLWRNNKKLIAINNELKSELEQLKSQQLKPNWDDAPDWANWLAQDSDGQWKWYELKPDIQVHGFSSSEGCRDEAEFLKDWQQTLEQRPNKIRKAIAWGLGNKVVSGVEYPKVKPFVVDWEHAPSDAVEYAVIEYYTTKDGHTCSSKTLCCEQRPQPPAPKVEVGQVWRSDNSYEFPNSKCKIIGIDDESIAFEFRGIFKIRVLDIPDFLEKFERVS